MTDAPLLLAPEAVVAAQQHVDRLAAALGECRVNVERLHVEYQQAQRDDQTAYAAALNKDPAAARPKAKADAAKGRLTAEQARADALTDALRQAQVEVEQTREEQATIWRQAVVAEVERQTEHARQAVVDAMNSWSRLWDLRVLQAWLERGTETRYKPFPPRIEGVTLPNGELPVPETLQRLLLAALEPPAPKAVPEPTTLAGRRVIRPAGGTDGDVIVTNVRNLGGNDAA